jgi:hypothetical protein
MAGSLTDDRSESEGRKVPGETCPCAPWHHPGTGNYANAFIPLCFKEREFVWAIL